MSKSRMPLAACAALLVASGCAHGQPAEDASPRGAVLREAGPGAALTLLPVSVLGRPSVEVAEVLGLVLENQGMTSLTLSDRAFSPPPEASWEQTPAALAEFLRQNRPAGARALYAEFLGEPKNGPTEVRFIVADADGAVALIDRQTAADRDFKRTAAADPDPLGCSALVAKRLFSQMGWRKGRPPADGPFARRWAEKSGTPAKEEYEAMALRLEAFRRALRESRVDVLASRVSGKADSASSARLVQALTRELGCTASANDTALSIEVAPSSNQQKRLWDLARGFQGCLRTSPPAGDFALLAEFGVDPAGVRPAAYVHFVVCDKSGAWVIVDFQNDQHRDFQRIAPRSAEDCERLVVARLRSLLGK